MNTDLPNGLPDDEIAQATRRALANTVAHSEATRPSWKAVESGAHRALVLRRIVAGATTVLVVTVGIVGAIAAASHTSRRGVSVVGSDSIVSATNAGDSARFEAHISIGAFGAAPDLALAVSGSVDFTDHRGSATLTQLPTPSTTTDSGGTAADGASSSQASTPTSAVVAESRWIGNRDFSKGASGLLAAVATKPWTLLDGDRIHDALPCIPAGGASSLVLVTDVSTDPSAVLETLRGRGTILSRIGTESIRGVSTTHWRAPQTTSQPNRCPPSTRARSTVKTTVDVWTDSANRARRIEVRQTKATPAQHADDGVNTIPAFTQTLDGVTEFYGFGTPVNVQAPPADQIYDATDGFIAQSRGPGTASSWKVIAQGTLSTGPWKIYAARTTTGWWCYDPQGTPKGIGVIVSNGSPKHGNRPSTCSVPGTGSLLGVFNAFVNTNDGGRRIVVGVSNLPGVARITFTDGTSAALTVDPTTSLVNWSQPSSGPSPVRIVVDGNSCRLDGQGNPLSNQPGAPVPTGSAVSPHDEPCGGTNPAVASGP